MQKNLICDETCSHLHPAQDTPCQNCHCDSCPSILTRTFFFDYTQSPPDLVDITDSVSNGVPNWFSTSPLPVQYLAWFRVSHLMQHFWKAHITTTCYHIPHVITLWNQLLVHFNTFYPVHTDPLLLLPGLNEPGLNENSWELVSSFSN